MSKSIYIATTEPKSGKSLLSLGVLQMMLTKSSRVGYFRPVINESHYTDIDHHTKTAVDFFGLDLNYEDCYAYTQKEVINLLGQGKIDDVLNTVIAKYKELEAKFDYVLVEGSDFSGEASLTEFDMNLTIAKNLGIPAMIVGSGKNKTAHETANALFLTYQSFTEKEVDVIGVVANKVNQNDLAALEIKLSSKIPSSVHVDIVPKVDFLDNPTVREVCTALEGDVLFGDSYLDNTIGNFTTGAMQLRNYLTHIKEDTLVITPGDRADIILGALQANISSNYPKIAGIILTGNLRPEDSILKLVEGVKSTVPIILVKENTFKIANEIGAVQSKIYSSNQKKILMALDVFDRYVNTQRLTSSFTSYSSDKVTPRMFQYNMLQKAKKHRKHIVLPEGEEERIIEATYRLQLLDIVDLTLLGNIETIQLKANRLGFEIDFDKVQVLNPEDSIHNDAFAKTLYEARKHKGMTETTAADLVPDVSYYGTLMILNGLADGMVSGAIHTTQHTIRPALQLIKTKPGVSVVSSVFFMCLSDRVSVMGDCAVNPNPNAEQLAEIAVSSAQSSEAFGINARVAMLSYSSGNSGKGEEVEKVRKATEIVKAEHPEIKVEGPIQYDAAVDISVAKTKLPDSEVAGQASVLIFPDLNTGNNTYKAIQRETGALAIGPMLQGLNKPVNDLSRGCTVDDIFNTVLLTAIQAEQN
jgi:phosphate acetyltransferase